MTIDQLSINNIPVDKADGFAFEIVTVIAIILFARLGMRLLFGYLKSKKNREKEDQSESKK